MKDEVGGGHVRTEIQIVISAAFEMYLEQAAGRFRYLYPDVELSISEGTVTFSAQRSEVNAVKRDFHFCLYRQRIYADSLPLREKLIESVMGR